MPRNIPSPTPDHGCRPTDRWPIGRLFALALTGLLVGGAGAALATPLDGDDATPPADEMVLELHDFVSPLAPALPDPIDLPVQLLLDDDSAEGVFGILGGTARQFLWFNSFPSAGDFRLQEIWVLFPDDPAIPLGGEVQLVVYRDPDQDPTNGAELLATYDGETIQVTDGGTFSVYPLDPPLDIVGGGDILIGVVNRYYQTGIDPPPTEPAAVDTDTSQGRSYFALWSGDAPAAPTLDDAILVDVLAGPTAGNHMIRGFGGLTPVIDVPTLNGAGLALLVAVLGLAGFVLTRRSVLTRRKTDTGRG